MPHYLLCFLYISGLYISAAGSVCGRSVSPPCFLNDDLTQSVDDLRSITSFEKIQDQIRQLKTQIELRITKVC